MVAITAKFFSVLLTLFLFLFVPIASADVTELNVPSMVVQGDVMCISGKTLPNESVWLKSSFCVSLSVSEGEYHREFVDIEFIEGEKTFSVTAENVKNLRASIYPVFWQTVTYPLGSPKAATNGTATISISFPVTWNIAPFNGEFDIHSKKDVSVYGDAADNATVVTLTTDMAIYLPVNETGNFTLTINTDSFPLGNFLISTGELEKTVEIVSEATPTPTPTPTPTQAPSSSSGGGGGGGGGGSVVSTTQTPTPAPLENATMNETTTPTPTPASTITAATQIPQIKNETEHDKVLVSKPSPTPQDKTSVPPQKPLKPFSSGTIVRILVVTLILIGAVIIIAKIRRKKREI